MARSKKKAYKPGDTLVMRTRVDEDPLIFEWADKQGEIGDAIRFLIEQEIRTNGLRNLAENIQSRRPPLALPDENSYQPTILFHNTPIPVHGTPIQYQDEPVSTEPKSLNKNQKEGNSTVEKVDKEKIPEQESPFEGADDIPGW